MRLLVVEDEKRISEWLARGMESAGYAVDVAGDGNTAIDLVHAANYDMIILDLGLPDMDGLQVLEKILDPTFSTSSFGFRPGRGAHDALAQASRYVSEGRPIVVDLDGPVLNLVSP